MYHDYLNPAVRAYRNQLVVSPCRDELVRAASIAERLLEQVDPAQLVEDRWLFGQLGCPVGSHGGLVSGEAVQHDLRRLVEDLSEAIAVPVEEVGERVYTVDELASSLDVSTKTIARWREQGLVARRFRFSGGRIRVGFLQSSVDHFTSKFADRIARAQRFCHLSDGERERILQQATEMANAGMSRSSVTQRLVRTSGRSRETIRYTLQGFWKARAQGTPVDEMTTELKERVFSQYRRGESVESLAQRHGRTPNRIYRIISRVRASRILQLPLEFIHNAEFDLPDASERILAPVVEEERSVRKVRVPSGLPPYLAALYDVPLLSREQEQDLFRRFNYLRYRAYQLRCDLDADHPKAHLMDRIESLYEQAVQIKNRIIQANLRLVVSLARQRVSGVEGFFDLVSDGNISLMRAVEKFDYSRGNKFSTYATWAIIKNFARTIPGEMKHLNRFRTTQDELLSATADHRDDNTADEGLQVARETEVNRILGFLSPREQHVIVGRYGLDHNRQPRTLQQLGEELGVTKERVRQLEARALLKLRRAARPDEMDLN